MALFPSSSGGGGKIKKKTISVSTTSSTGNATTGLRTTDVTILSMATHSLTGNNTIIVQYMIYQNVWFIHLISGTDGNIVPVGTSADVEIVYVDNADIEIVT